MASTHGLLLDAGDSYVDDSYASWPSRHAPPPLDGPHPEHLQKMLHSIALSLVPDESWVDPAIAGGVFLLSLALAFIFNKLVFNLALRLTHWTPTDLDSRLLRSTRLPLTLVIIVVGAYLALTLPLDLASGQQNAVDTFAGVLGVVIGVLGAASLVGILFDWYVDNVGRRARPVLDLKFIPLIRRVATTLVYGLGALLVMDRLGLDVTPLVAGLGLGGLAVALAIQPTLANLFAGTYVMTEGVIAPGDYIELENGIGGYVVDVGWRSTRIRTWSNNLVVVPNSRFAETIITNYQAPSPPVNVFLTCGVAYESDLYHVETVCRQVMDDVLDSSDAAVKEFGGWFGYESFGDSNVDFWLFVQAKSRLASFDLRTVLVQRLHQRLKEEGIVINYPVRTLQLPKGWEGGEAGTPLFRAQTGPSPGQAGRSPTLGMDIPESAAEADAPGPE